METVTKKKLYEGMFLIDSAVAGSDWEGVNNTIKTILERYGSEIVSLRKWDDRKLAYDIRGKSRGTYILCYFRADGSVIGDIEQSVQLSEQIIRVLILNAEKMAEDDIAKDTPALKAEKEKQQSPEEDIADTDNEQSDESAETEKVEEDSLDEVEVQEETQEDNIAKNTQAQEAAIEESEETVPEEG